MFMTPTITGRHHPVRQSQRRRRGAHLALTRQPQEAQAGDDELVELLDLTEIKPVNEELAAAFGSRPALVSDNLVSAHAGSVKVVKCDVRRALSRVCGVPGGKDAIPAGDGRLLGGCCRSYAPSLFMRTLSTYLGPA